MIDNKKLSFGIFWVIADSEDLDPYNLLCFSVPYDTYGRPADIPEIQLNSKSGASYNHKAVWNSHVKNNRSHKPYNKQDYNYYPRGRVEVSNNKVTIYLNPYIIQPQILDDIKAEFGLIGESVPNIRIVADNSTHYACFLN